MVLLRGFQNYLERSERVLPPIRENFKKINKGWRASKIQWDLYKYIILLLHGIILYITVLIMQIVDYETY